jgi:uncharacterized membrane protein YraQ (UPF0718 family)
MKSSHPVLDALFSVLIPSMILMKFNYQESLEPIVAQIIALSLPPGWGLVELIRYPMIAITSMLMMMGILCYLRSTIERMTGLSLQQILFTQTQEKSQSWLLL